MAKVSTKTTKFPKAKAPPKPKAASGKQPVGALQPSKLVMPRETEKVIPKRVEPKKTKKKK